MALQDDEKSAEKEIYNSINCYFLKEKKERKEKKKKKESSVFWRQIVKNYIQRKSTLNITTLPF